MGGFYENLKRYQDRIALISENRETISYRELSKSIDSITEPMQIRKLAFLICGNNIESISFYLGCLNKGIVPVLINQNITKELYDTLLEQYKPTYLVMPKGWQSNPVMKHILSYRSYEVLETNFNVEYELNKDLALLLTTSGSTGSPKLVRQSYKNINHNAQSIAAYLEINEDDRAITTMPMNYTYGLSIINSHLLKGATIILNEYTLMNKEFWQLLQDEKATTFGGVPYIYEMLKKLRFSKMNLPSLKYITQAGGKLSKEMAEEFNTICEEKGIKLIIMYGQTEATARMAYLPWEKAREKAGSMGIAIPGGKFTLIDEEGNEIIEANITGELVYTGENVTLGYAESYRDLSDGDINQGVLFTGDMARRDEDGFYYIVGRKKRFLKLFGNRINLDEVEGLLKREGYECACAGYDDHMQIYSTSKSMNEDIKSFVSQLTHIHPSAFEMRYIDEIPRNEAGKILYSALK
ncbi:MAG: AMP-binding protein [Cellulosilyticum sp.]|nr:AMP-binding protein [Cellulosilyticum sp.]